MSVGRGHVELTHLAMEHRLVVVAERVFQ